MSSLYRVKLDEGDYITNDPGERLYKYSYTVGQEVYCESCGDWVTAAYADAVESHMACEDCWDINVTEFPGQGFILLDLGVGHFRKVNSLEAAGMVIVNEETDSVFVMKVKDPTFDYVYQEWTGIHVNGTLVGYQFTGDIDCETIEGG